MVSGMPCSEGVGSIYERGAEKAKYYIYGHIYEDVSRSTLVNTVMTEFGALEGLASGASSVS